MTRQTSAIACKRCPQHSSTTGTAAQSENECVCDAEYYDAIVGPGVDCKLCPVGTSCQQGSKLEELPISVGYYRLDTTSVDVRLCASAQSRWSACAAHRASVLPCRCAAAPMLTPVAPQKMVPSAV